jgi:Rrf2 family protein
MALLNRKVDYSLLILSYLHEHPAGGCARVLAERFDLSRAFVANILKRLCRKGLVGSTRGIKGGYVLMPRAMQVNLAELMEALDDTFQLAECNSAVPEQCCSLFEFCPVKGPVAEVDRRIREVLQDVTMADLFGVEPERMACRTLEVVS